MSACEKLVCLSLTHTSNLNSNICLYGSYPAQVSFEMFNELKLTMTNSLAYNMKVFCFIVYTLGAEAGALA
jgi:hypothetical protein